MSYADLQSAAMKAAKAFIEAASPTGLANIPAAWPNVSFEPPVDAPYVEINMLPVGSDPVTIGLGGDDEHKEILQLSLYFPMQVGEGAIVAAASAAKNYFSAGSTATHNGSLLTFTKTKTSPRFKSDNRFVCHVSAFWRGRTSRPTSLTRN